MKAVPIVDILRGLIPINNIVTVYGWLRTRRDSKAGISFLTIYDGSCLEPLQAVINNNLINYQTDILNLTTGCSLVLTGQVVKSSGSGQCFEIQTDKVDVLGWVDNPSTYPIGAKRHSLEYLRKVAHLRPRTNIIGAIARIRHTLAQAIHRFMNEHGFLWVSTPLITASNTEGAGKVFNVSTLDIENLPLNSKGRVSYEDDFFGKKSFLTVSGQLNGESYACALSKIYTFGPAFRAENSNTNRHLSEFWMFEPEIAFATLNNIATLAELLLKYIFQAVLTERSDDMMFFSQRTDKKAISRLEQFINTECVQIEYTEAIDILLASKQKFSHKVLWGIELSAEHERYLAEKHFKSIVIVKNYPKYIKAFYMRINDDDKTVAAMDILAPGIGEIIGGSQREERLYKLDERLADMKLNKQDYWWYRDLRRYGTVPHAGFGLGFERLIMYVTGIKNIRDVIPFPRCPNNITF